MAYRRIMKNGLSGFQRLAIVLLLCSAASIGTTFWAYAELKAGDRQAFAAADAWTTAPPHLQTDASDLGKDLIYANEQAIQKGEFYLAMRKWTGLAHLAALALAALAWVADGFLRRRKPVPDSAA